MRSCRSIVCAFALLFPLLLSAQEDSIRRAAEVQELPMNQLNEAKRLFAQYVYSQVDSAIFYAQKVVDIATALENADEILTGNTYLGIGYSIKGDYTKAIEYMSETLRLHTEAGDSLNMAYSLNNIGTTYLYDADYLKAVESFLSSSRIKEALVASGTPSADVDLASTLNNIGIAYQSQLDTAQAKTYYARAIEEADKVDNAPMAARSKASLGNLLSQEKRFEESLTYLLEAEEVLVAENDAFSLGKLYNNMAKTYAGLENGEAVLAVAQKSITVNKQIGNLDSEAQGRVYLGLGYIKTGQYRQAISTSLEALKYGEANESNIVLAGAYQNLYEAYAALGNYKRAYDYNLLYQEVDEAIFTAQRAEQIERMSAEFEADKRELEIDRLNQATRVQALELSQADAERNLLIVLVGSLLLILLLIGYFYRKIVQSRQLLQTQNTELDRLNSTKDRFFAIISHDLRGHISAFQGNGKLLKHLLGKNQLDKVDRVTEELDKNATNLSALLDNLLQWSLEQLKGYEPKPEQLKVSAALGEVLLPYHALAEAKGLSLTNEVDEALTALVDRNGFSVIFRNLVANAIKFTQEGSIVLSAEVEGEQVTIRVKDSGIGIPNTIQENLFKISEDKIRRGTQHEKGTGLGLNLVYEFVRANGGQLQVESQEGEGTTIIVSLKHG